MNRTFSKLIALFTFSAVVAAPSIASAVTFRLHNHPDGNQNPPPYGFRLDGLFGDVDDEYTFDFDYSKNGFESAVFLDFDGSTIRIHGSVFGGEDVGASGAYGLNQGIYQIDFQYNANVSGDLTSGLTVTAENHSSNIGTITYDQNFDGSSFGDIADQVFNLEDEQGGNAYSFKFNNLDTHRVTPEGHTPLYEFEGWGWVNHSLAPATPTTHIYSSDWLFTGEQVPDSGTTAFLILIALVGLESGRRKLQAREA